MIIHNFVCCEGIFGSKSSTILVGVNTDPKDALVAIVSIQDDEDNDSSERVNLRDFLALANSASDTLIDLRAATTSSRA